VKNFYQNLFFPFRVFTIFAIAFLVGVLLASIVHFSFYRIYLSLIFLLLALLVSLAINLLIKSRFVALPSFALFALVLGLGYFSFCETRHTVSLPFGQTTQFEGRVIKRPFIDDKKQQVVIKSLEFDCGKEAIILVTLPRFPEYHFGESLKFSGQVEKPQNIGEFDYVGYLKRYHIFGVMKPERVIFVNENRGFFWDLAEGFYFIAERFEKTFAMILPEPHASLAAGILLGAKKNMPEDFAQNLQETGLTHIIALSGFNITILIALFAEFLASYLTKRQIFFLGLVFVSAFVFMTGGQPSAIRAAIFAMLLLFGKTLGRRADQTNLMLLAALVMVLINPYILYFDTGFQLSFLAFAGLIYLSGPMLKFTEKFGKKMFSWLQKPLAETLSAQIAVFPILVFKFGTISLISPLANLAVVWVVQWTMLFCFIPGFLGAIYYPLGKLFSFLAWPFLQYIILVVNLFAGIPGGSFKIK
jgi:competence protein ComEC